MTVQLIASMPVSTVSSCDNSTSGPRDGDGLAVNADAMDLSSRRDWQAAYGPGPCHRAAKTPDEWREAVEEKRRVEARLLLSLGAAGATPAALVGAAQRLQKKAPLPALLAFRLAGPEVRDGRAATELTLTLLRKEGRYDELVEYAAAALERFPDLAVQVMNWGVEARHLPLCRLAKATGAALSGARRFTPELAARSGDWELVRHLCEDPRGISPHEWAHALCNALLANEVEMARTILPVLAEALRQRGNPWKPRGADLTCLPDAAAQDEALRIMQEAGCQPSSILHTTAGSHRHTLEQTLSACRKIRDVFVTPDAWQAELDRLCNLALRAPHEVGHYEFRVLRALGGQCTDVAGGIAALEIDCEYQHLAKIEEERITHLLCASGDGNLQIKGKPLRVELIRRLIHTHSWRVIQVLEQLADAGIGLQSGDFPRARRILEEHQFQMDVLRPLLRMGFPANSPAILTACAKAGPLESVQLLVEEGAQVFDYDDSFQTAIDVATEPRMVAYLQGLGLEPMDPPELRLARPVVECDAVFPDTMVPRL